MSDIATLPRTQSSLDPVTAKLFERVLWPRRELSELLGMSEKSIERFAKCGEFPAPVALGNRAKRWRAVDVAAWVDRLGT